MRSIHGFSPRSAETSTHTHTHAHTSSFILHRQVLTQKIFKSKLCLVQQHIPCQRSARNTDKLCTSPSTHTHTHTPHTHARSSLMSLPVARVSSGCWTRPCYRDGLLMPPYRRIAMLHCLVPASCSLPVPLSLSLSHSPSVCPPPSFSQIGRASCRERV